MKRWLQGAWAVFEKDIKLELRSRYAINTILLFVLATLLLMAFAVGPEALAPRIESALLWIVIVFSAALGLGRSFVSEQERGTVLLLLLHTHGSMVYAGKLLFNFLFVLGLNLLAVVTFVLLLGVHIELPGLLLTTLVLGALGLAGATTLLAAIIARTTTRGPLLPVLVFPMLIPLLLAVVTATRHALPDGLGWAAVTNELLTLVGFAGVVISASIILFDYVWYD